MQNKIFSYEINSLIFAKICNNTAKNMMNINSFFIFNYNEKIK
jgi:hypothetical protein